MAEKFSIEDVEQMNVPTLKVIYLIFYLGRAAKCQQGSDQSED